MTRSRGSTVESMESRATSIRRALLAWFRVHARELPWRTTPRNPWAVWVSEVMLQQTRVTTVIPYFEAFMRRYPTVRSMAEADLDEVLSAWSGLGYYRRARALHTGAREVVERFEGKIPGTIEELRSLPGIGDYTAAAIGSLAFGIPAAVLDGNVRRVIARLAAIREQGKPGANDPHRRIADALLSSRKPGAFNEAMMELGALVCTPGVPHCETCPLRAMCEARRLGLENEIPELERRAPSPTIQLVAAVITQDDKLLMARRVRDGLFGGMWDPPLFDQPIKTEWRAWLGRAIGSSLKKPSRLPDPIGSVRHVLTHRVLEVEVIKLAAVEEFVGEKPAFPPGYDAMRWMQPREVRGSGVSSLASKILKVAGVG